ncbi:MAG: hypothetical protein M1501_00880 [Candidatus Omnitrophica bacterium]|nr:hypothetical protein [Candidatus Omnitrophota bacterium]
MKEIFKILDKLDREENIYLLIKKYSNRAHQIMKSNSSSVSGDMIDVVKITLKEILQEISKQK